MFFIAALLLFFGTGREPDRGVPAPAPAVDREVKKNIAVRQKSDEALKLELLGLVNAKDFAPTLAVQLAYAGADNLLQTQLYHDLNDAYLQRDAAYKLAAAQRIVQGVNHDLCIIVRDAVRPQRVQAQCWELAKQRGLQHLFTHPQEVSMHSYGVAVDVSLVSIASKTELDMGCPVDAPGALAAPRREAEMLRLGRLSPVQYANRLLLRNAMTQAGFRSIGNEWWHFEACSRRTAQELYQPIR
jgi:D-alanyl-D-alanine dipeptidase